MNPGDASGNEIVLKQALESLLSKALELADQIGNHPSLYSLPFV